MPVRAGVRVDRQCLGWVSHPGTWRDSRDIAGLVNDLFGLGDETSGSRWRMLTVWDAVVAWRRLRLFLRSLRDR